MTSVYCFIKGAWQQLLPSVQRAAEQPAAPANRQQPEKCKQIKLFGHQAASEERAAHRSSQYEAHTASGDLARLRLVVVTDAG